MVPLYLWPLTLSLASKSAFPDMRRAAILMLSFHAARCKAVAPSLCHKHAMKGNAFWIGGLVMSIWYTELIFITMHWGYACTAFETNIILWEVEKTSHCCNALCFHLSVVIQERLCCVELTHKGCWTERRGLNLRKYHSSHVLKQGTHLFIESDKEQVLGDLNVKAYP